MVVGILTTIFCSTKAIYMDVIIDYSKYSTEELREAVQQIKNPNKQKEQIYAILTVLGISYKPTNCGKCNRDYLLIAKEELGLIESAAELSEWNEGCKYEYVHHRTVMWNGHKMNQYTNPMIIREFVESGLNANNKYYKQID